MSNYHLRVRLDNLGISTAQVRVWIDNELACDLSSKREIELARHDEQSWTGRFSAGDGGFVYLVGICAEPGTVWELSVREDAGKNDELLFDSDVLMMTKEWLVGTCEPVLLETDSPWVRVDGTQANAPSSR